MRAFVAIVIAFSFLSSLQAGNLVELHYVLPENKDGAIAAELASSELWLSPEVVIADADIESATVTRLDEDFAIMLKLTNHGAERFDQFAAKHLGDQLAILVRGKVVSAPVVRESKFGGTIQISGNFNEKEAMALVSALNKPRQ